jgi:hypothetical protein
MWFTETPWPPIFILLVVCCFLVAAWQGSKRAVYLIWVGVLLAACAGVYFYEQATVTESERVEQNVHDLVHAFQRKDKQTTLNFFSPQADQFRSTVEKAIELVDVRDDVDVKDVNILMMSENTQAVSQFRANATVSVRGLVDYTHQPSRWELTWQKEAGEWKIVAVQRLNPVTGEKMGIWQQSSH